VRARSPQDVGDGLPPRDSGGRLPSDEHDGIIEGSLPVCVQAIDVSTPLHEPGREWRDRMTKQPI
jgi:hypothetical protein